MDILLFIAALAIIAAFVAVESANLLTSIVALGAFGFISCLLFLIDGASKLAIFQLALELYILYALVKATASVTEREKYDIRSVLILITALSFAVAFLMGAYFAIKDLPAFSSRLSQEYDLTLSLAVYISAIAAAIALLRRENDG